MIRCAVRIEGDSWEAALDAAGLVPPYGLEVPVGLLESCARFVQRFELEDLGIVNIREALPVEHAPYMDECPAPIRRGLTTALASTLELGRCFGAECATLDLGLDRVCGMEGLANRAEILKDALSVSTEGPVLCMQIRVPRRFPLSREWRLAKELVSACDSQRVGVAANVVIHDISPQPHPDEVRELLGNGLRLVRFLLDNSTSDSFLSETIETWAEAMKAWERPPAVVFSCRHRNAGDLPAYHAAASRVARELFDA
jgi:hypothetical protein